MIFTHGGLFPCLGEHTILICEKTGGLSSVWDMLSVK